MSNRVPPDLRPLNADEEELLNRSRDWIDRRKALDPSVYKPRYYTVTVNIENDVDKIGSNSKQIDTRPFIIDSVQHSIIGVTDQNGQYLVNWRDNITTYTADPTNAVNLFGNAHTGQTVPLPCRVFLRGGQTLSIDLVSKYMWSSGGSFIDIQFTFTGFEFWNRRL